MTIELRMLVYSAILGFVQIFVAAGAGTQIRGLKWNAGARDEVVPPLTGVAGRLDRAMENFKETFPLFLAAVFLVHVCNTANAMTALGAQLYFWGRLIYVPLYATGVPFIRTLVWGAATVGIFLLLGSLF